MESTTMKVAEALAGISTLFLDTAPVIYFGEASTKYLSIADPIFDLIDAGELLGVVSPVTLAECLVLPLRNNDTEGITLYKNLLADNVHIRFVPIDQAIATRAATLRAKYGLKLPDALQLATALVSGSDVFLTNDASLKQVSEVRVLLMDELEV